MLICECCNKLFEVSYKYAKSNKPKYCSKQCRRGPSNKDKIFKCLECGKNFKVNYHISKNQKPKYCSKQCAQHPRYPRKHILMSDIKKYIKSKKRYCTAANILQALNISSSLLSRHSISIIKVNKELGYKQPVSMMEHLVEELLDNYDVLYYTQYSFDDLVAIKKLRFDFYFPNDALAIELDDASHYDTSHRYYNEGVAQRDQLKDEYCKLQNIKLIRLQYYRVSDDSAQVLLQIHNIMIGLGYSKSNNSQSVLNQQPGYKETCYEWFRD